jgi:adenine-specific DNA-methyltransferase
MNKKLDEYTKEELLEYITRLRKDTKFGLVWNPKDEHVVKDCETKVPVLEEMSDRKIIKAGKDDTTHLLIEGDNYHSLSVLNYTHGGKVDVIYIDPPYNTGNKDFIYNDHYIDKDDPYRHSQWLTFMDNRLRLAKRLLADTGVMFISIDDNEQAHLKILCDTIFGEENFLTTLNIQVRYADKSLNEEKPFKPLLEYVLVYAKNARSFQPNRPKEQYTSDKFVYEIVELEDGNDIEQNGHKVTVFKKGQWKLVKHKEGANNLLKETWISGSIYTTMSYGKVFQSVVEPRIIEDGLGSLYKVHGRGDDGLGYRYYTAPQRATATRGKMYSGMPLSRVEEMESDEGATRMAPIPTFYDYSADFGNIRHEGGIGFNSGKKPVKMLKQLINLHTNKNAVVLDFFAGSGSTGQAVLEANQEDDGKRQCILGTNNENGIAENITYKRMSNVINGYNNTKGIPANLRYFKTDFVDTSGLRKLTDKEKLEITSEMGAMIALRENSFEQVEQTDHWQTYENDTQLTAIYFREDKTQIQKYLDKLSAQDKPVKLYVFGWGKNAGTEYASKKINVEDIPEPLIEVYKELAK